MAPTDGHSRDTTQSPQIAPHPTPSPSPPSVPLPAFDVPSLDDVKNGAAELLATTSKSLPILQQQSERKLCVRHQRMADEGTSLKLQQV